MTTLERRLIALEQAANLQASLPKPHAVSLTLDDFHRIRREIVARPQSTKTPEEQIADFKADLARMQANWGLRHEHA